MTRSINTAWTLMTCLTFASTLSGCAGGLEFAAIGAAANATQAGSAVVKGGKINGAVLAPADAVVEAIRLALADADLTISGIDRKRAYRTALVAKDDRGARISIRVRERTAELSRVQVDVGWFGDAATARLVAMRIQYHLRENGHTFDDEAVTQADADHDHAAHFGG